MVPTGNGSVKSFGGPSMKQLYMYHSKGIVVYYVNLLIYREQARSKTLARLKVYKEVVP